MPFEIERAIQFGQLGEPKWPWQRGREQRKPPEVL